MKKKYIFLSIGIVVGLVLSFGAYFLISNLNQEEKLNKEINDTLKLFDYENLQTDKIDKKLNNIVTNEEYGVVEKAIKQYLSDIHNNIMEISEILNDEKITNILTIENYKNDGKEFLNTNQYINETVEKLNNLKLEYVELLSNNKVMSYINNKNLDDYYIDYYKKQIKLFDINHTSNTIENSLDDMINLLKASKEILNFLTVHKDSWEIENNKLYFEQSILLDEYNMLLSSISSET